MKTLNPQAAYTWAQLQELLNARNPEKVNPNNDFKNITVEERKARIVVTIDNFLRKLHENH